MPANRSRTDRWRDCLWQVYERGGGLEIALARPDSGEPGHDLVWRVRVLHLSETEIVVEQPAAFGRTFAIQPGQAVVGAMSIGQNKWMFSTNTLPGGPAAGLHLAMPEKVERCQRRSYFRVATAGVELPAVECWPLLDPSSVVAAEVANEAYIRDLLRRRQDSSFEAPTEPQVLPDVGPRFPAKLVNLSGGGLGLLVAPGEGAGLDRARFLWMRVDLGPDLPAPLAITGRVAHTHMDSAQNTHVGIAFEFGFHASHRDFVISQVCGVVAKLQASSVSDAA